MSFFNLLKNQIVQEHAKEQPAFAVASDEDDEDEINLGFVPPMQFKVNLEELEYLRDKYKEYLSAHPSKLPAEVQSFMQEQNEHPKKEYEGRHYYYSFYVDSRDELYIDNIRQEFKEKLEKEEEREREERERSHEVDRAPELKEIEDELALD